MKESKTKPADLLEEMESETKKTRNTGMKWLKLGRDAEPSFDQLYFLADGTEVGKSDHAYDKGKLFSVTNKSAGVEYAFVTGYDKDEAKEIIETRFTHYCIIKQPGE